MPQYITETDTIDNDIQILQRDSLHNKSYLRFLVVLHKKDLAN